MSVQDHRSGGRISAGWNIALAICLLGLAVGDVRADDPMGDWSMQRPPGWNSPQQLAGSESWNMPQRPVATLEPAWRPDWSRPQWDSDPRTAQAPNSLTSENPLPHSADATPLLEREYPSSREWELETVDSRSLAFAETARPWDSTAVYWSRPFAPTASDSRGWLYGQSVIPSSLAVPGPHRATSWWWDAVGRANYVNDHRIEFTGQEATFGVEGIVRGGLTRATSDWVIHGGTELLITQPFDDNILVDSVDRRAFAPNFNVDVLRISQMVLAAERGDLEIGLGKFVTPFGRTYFPIFTNDRWETPFIRAEAVDYRETGGFISYSPGNWDFDVALTNGNPDRDTNSSKAVVSRIGWSNATWVLGGSLKYHDGVGSEDQKVYHHHVGFDAAWRCGRWTACTEMILDHYGYRRDTFAPGGITWGRSLYHRDIPPPGGGTLTAWGYYAGLRHDGDLWTTWLSYGEFFPDPVGDRIHDTANRRFLVKGVRRLGAGVDWYGA
ncbi:MAG: hypothetical protein R3B96_03925 [Pirellulaceae bacterium]